MATAQAFARQLKIATAGLDDKAISAKLALVAREALAQAIQAGEASDTYVRSVNGRIGASEDSVQAPGPIVYRFLYLEEAVRYALAYAQARSPLQSGRYRKSWFVLVNGRQWDLRSAIPADAEAILTNDQPYHRKIEVGAMTMKAPPRIVEGTRQAVRHRFGSGDRAAVTTDIRYIQLAGGYRLKRSEGRNGRHAGDPLTYPALVLRVA